MKFLKRVVAVSCACISMLLTAFAVQADETVMPEHAQATEQETQAETNYAIDNDCNGYYTVHVSYKDAVNGTGAQGMLKINVTDGICTVVDFNEVSFLKDYPGIKIDKYKDTESMKTQSYEPLTEKAVTGKYYIAQFVSRNNKIAYTGVVAVLTEDTKHWFEYNKTENADDAEDTAGTDMHREMTGQVELNELDDATLNRLAEINNELEQLKNTSTNSFATSIVNVVTNIVGIVLIVYAVVLVVTYVLEVMGVGDDTIRPFHLATFKRNWAVGTDYEYLTTYAMADMHGGVTIAHLVLRCVLLVVCGILAISVDWFTIAYTVYHALKG